MRYLKSTSLAALAAATALPAHAGEPLDPSTVSLAPAPAPTYAPASAWEFELVPYAWLSGVKGQTGYSGIISDIDLPFDDVLSNLDFAAFGTFNASYGRWVFTLDGMYVKISADQPINGPLFNKADVSTWSGMGNLVAGYNVVENDRGYVMNVYGGTRVTYSKTKIRLQENLAPHDFGRSASESWWDAIVGVRGNIPLGERFFLRYAADVGGGSSDLTWQAMATLGFKCTRNIDLRLGYRHLDVDYEKGDQNFVYDMETSGPVLGLGFTW